MYLGHHHRIVSVSLQAANGKVETCFVVEGQKEHPVSVQVSKIFEGVGAGGAVPEIIYFGFFSDW